MCCSLKIPIEFMCSAELHCIVFLCKAAGRMFRTFLLPVSHPALWSQLLFSRRQLCDPDTLSPLEQPAVSLQLGSHRKSHFRLFPQPSLFLDQLLSSGLAISAPLPSRVFSSDWELTCCPQSLPQVHFISELFFAASMMQNNLQGCLDREGLG